MLAPRSRRSTLAIEAGKGTLRGLATGRHRFRVFPDDLVIEPSQLDLDASSSVPIVVRWRAR